MLFDRLEIRLKNWWNTRWKVERIESELIVRLNLMRFMGENYTHILLEKKRIEGKFETHWKPNWTAEWKENDKWDENCTVIHHLYRHCMHYLKRERKFVEWPVKNCYKIVKRDLNAYPNCEEDGERPPNNRHHRDFHFQLEENIQI